MAARNVKTAVKLIEEAWAKRWETMKSPPDSKEELQRNVDEVHQNLVEAVAICRETGAKRELVHALRKLGHVEQAAGREEAARALYEEAVAVSRQQEDSLLLAHSVRHLGDVYREAGKAAEAEANYNEALALYRKHGQPPALDFANTIRPMAILKEEAAMIEEAKNLWREARDLYCLLYTSPSPRDPE